MTGPPTREEIFAHCGVSETQLERTCTDKDITEIAVFIRWRDVAPRLGLDSNDIEEVEIDGKSESDRRLKALQKWKSKLGLKATYMQLVEVLCRLGMAEQAEKVCRLVAAHGKTLCIIIVNLYT